MLLASFTFINFFGIGWLSKVNSTLMWWKLIIPVLAVVVLLFKWHSGNWTIGGPGPIVAANPSNGSGGFAPFGAKGVLDAVVGAGIVFSYLGFEQADQLAGEIKNPQRNLPRAIIGAMLIGTAVYIMVQVVFIAAMDPAQLTNGFPGISDANVLSGPIAGLARLIGLGWLATLLRVDAFVSPYGTGLIYLTSTSRVTYALSRNRYLPQIFQRTDRRGVPWAQHDPRVRGRLRLPAAVPDLAEHRGPDHRRERAHVHRRPARPHRVPQPAAGRAPAVPAARPR